MTEQELVQRCADGDRGAQRMLYEQTSERIYGLLLRMTGNPHDASDLAQDTYVRAFDRIGQFGGHSSVATWLYRIAVNQALQHRRRSAFSESALRARAEQDSSPRLGDRADVGMDMEAALAGLDPLDRSVLLLRYDQGLDYRAIAEVLECAEGTVASRLNRARQRLREKLQRSYAETEEMNAAKHQN